MRVNISVGHTTARDDTVTITPDTSGPHPATIYLINFDRMIISHKGIMKYNANKYNKQRMADGALTPGAVTSLVRQWQHGHGLRVDGYYGPKTRVSVTRGRLGVQLMERALLIAIDDLGRGEVQANNVSPYLDIVRKNDGTGLPWKGYKAPWCAAALSYWYTRAEALVDSAGEIPWKSSRSSRALNSWLSQVATTDTVPRAGGVIIFKRGVLRRPGHVGIIEYYTPSTDTCGTIEGNSSKFPSLVRRRIYKNGAWRKKISGIYSF